eukprot:scaffold7525_cov248-Pinguiococcus_pyrenoidosus.AAC.5
MKRNEMKRNQQRSTQYTRNHITPKSRSGAAGLACRIDKIASDGRRTDVEGRHVRAGKQASCRSICCHGLITLILCRECVPEADPRLMGNEAGEVTISSPGMVAARQRDLSLIPTWASLGCNLVAL